MPESEAQSRQQNVACSTADVWRHLVARLAVNEHDIYRSVKVRPATSIIVQHLYGTCATTQTKDGIGTYLQHYIIIHV